ncbi:Hypothetical protein A7982_02101 [Minicystis rosea]|nr:Hypothetical protein A7982_02101 [Minicystis rosea]
MVGARMAQTDCELDDRPRSQTARMPEYLGAEGCCSGPWNGVLRTGDHGTT